MKKIAFLGAVLGAFSFVPAEGEVLAGGAAPVVEGESGTVGQHGFYYAIGVLLCNSGERIDYYGNNHRIVESNSFGTQFGGTLALGYQFMPQNKPLCVGLEVGSDFSPRHEEVQSDKTDSLGHPLNAGSNRFYSVRTTRNGFRPFVALRGGYVNYDHKFMVYMKAGMSYADSKEYYESYSFDTELRYHGGSTVKCSCWTPIIALGIEKSFTDNFTCRGEAEYKFARTKDKEFSDKTLVRMVQKGSFNVRVLFSHNMRLGQ